MKFAYAVFTAFLLTAAVEVRGERKVKGPLDEKEELLQDDIEFWDRFLPKYQHHHVKSMPPPPKNPRIKIIKSALDGTDNQQVRVGDRANFEITVTNTGDVPLTDVTVNDELAPRCDNRIGNLAVGESTTYQCSSGEVTQDFTNVAAVTGNDPDGRPVRDSDPSDVDVINPSIQIVKSAAEGGDTQQVRVGDTATFEITVTNNGNVDLTDVKVSDALAPECNSNIGSLGVGESTTYQCSVKVTSKKDFTNVADVTGKDPNGKPVKDKDPSEVEPIDPSIKIVKSAEAGGDSQQVRKGDKASFEITVTNNGNVDLTDVTVRDPRAPKCDKNIGRLDVGESTTYTCRSENVNGSFTNVADVTGKDPNGDTVKDEDPSDVVEIGPSIEIVKSALDGSDSQSVLIGDSATFLITVTNNGNVDLTDVVVSDELAPDCDRNIGDLAVGESTSYECAVTVTEGFTNVAKVTGEDPNGDPVEDEDPSRVRPKRTPKPTPPPTEPPKECVMEVGIDCKTTSGKRCDRLEWPSEKCSDDGPIEVLTFQFDPCDCSESNNRQRDFFICVDERDFRRQPVTISCFDPSENPLTVDPVEVQRDETFTVTNPSGGVLPTSITCTFSDSNGLIQAVSLDTSGLVNLKLKDKFGGMTLVSCDETTCLEELCYNYNFANIGSNDMTIIEAERDFNGETFDLLPFIPVNPLAPDESTSVEEKTIIDVCEAAEYVVDLRAKAEPENGRTCEDDDTYRFEIDPLPVDPTPSPTPPPRTPSPTPPPRTPSPTAPCTIEFTSECIPPPPATDCSAIPPAVQQCEGRPLMMGMLYNGGDCSQSFNVQENKFSCVDSNGGPPTIDGEQSYIVVTASKDSGIVYHSDLVEVGTIFYLTDNNNRFAADQDINIYEDASMSTELQDVTYHSSCSSNLFLKDRFGASQLVEWYNEEQGLISCFANATFDLSVTIPIDIQGDTLTLTSLVSITSWGVYNLTDDVFGTVVAPGDTIEASFTVTLDLTQVRTYELLTEIVGITNDGVECRGVDYYTFTAGTDLENLPPPAEGGSGGSNKGGSRKGGKLM